MASLSMWFLGGFRACLDGEPVTALRYDKVRAALAYLALESERPHRREALAGLLWPELSEQRARRNLSQVLYVLHSALDSAEAPFVVVTPQTVQFHPVCDHWLDVHAYISLLSACKEHAHWRLETCSSCVDRLERAVALYEGPFLHGLSLGDSPAFEEWQLVWREHLHQVAVDALASLAAGYEARGEHERALRAGRRWVELDPWHEAAHRQVMRALALSGRRNAALAQYEACRRTLAEELGVAPAVATVALYKQIRDDPEAGLLVETRLPHNLPAAATPFVGREKVLVQLTVLLQDPACRLVTLVGPGGIGKTRLALQCAEEVVAQAPGDRFPDGVYFVPLAPVHTVDAIVSAVAQAIGLSFHAGAEPCRQLLGYLRGKRMLLVLDNYEHLIAPSGDDEGGGQRGEGVEFLLEVLREAPGVKPLVTSRMRLNASGEHVLAVPGMDCPTQDLTGLGKPVRSVLGYSAVRLYLQQACRVRPGYEPDEEALAQIGRICRMVGGMPLAIELAAAWMDVLSPGEIAAELERSIAFLHSDLRDLPERHRSMVATFDASWGMLSERERQVFAALSVFRGGCTREAAEAVAGAGLEILRALVGKSFLTRDEDGRYQVHELLRQYGEDKLRQRPEVQERVLDRHCAFYATVLERWADELKSSRQEQASQEMGLESSNASAAWAWAVERGRWRDVGRAAEGLRRLFERGDSFREGRAAFEAAMARLEEVRGGRPGLDAGKEPVLSASEEPVLSVSEGTRLLLWLALCQFPFADDAETWQRLFQRCGSLLAELDLMGEDTRREQAELALQAASPTVWVVTWQEAREHARRALALYQELGDRWGMAMAHGVFGIQSFLTSDYEGARRHLEQELELSDSLGDLSGLVEAMFWLARSAIFQGQVEQSEQWLRKLSPAVTGWGSRFEDEQEGLWLWGEAHLLSGRYAEASAVLRECAARYRDCEGRVYLGRMLPILGMAQMHLGAYEQARDAAQEAVVLNRESLSFLSLGLALAVLGDVALVTGQETVALELLQRAAGVSRDAEDRKRLAEAVAYLAYVARRLGQEREARRNLIEAIRLSREIHSPVPLWAVLPACALLLADRGESERAAELYALAWSVPHIARSRWYEDVAGRQLAAVCEDLPPEVRETAFARGQAQDLWTMAKALLVELEKRA